MKALRIVSHSNGYTLEDIAIMQPQVGEIRVKIATCGLNFADLLIAEGRYQEKPELPFTGGMEAAGVVDSVGPGVTGFAPGDRVGVISGQGGLAEYGVFSANRCAHLPAEMSFETAAAFTIGYGTAHLALAHRAQLAPGEVLFVTGAAGGVGLTAVELGAAMGARVIASARGAEKLARAQAAGASHLIDSDSPDLTAQLRALGGVDVVYDAVGGPAFFAAMRATRPEGRLIPVGFAGGDVPQIPANHLLVKNLSVIGVYWGGYMSFRPEVLRRSLEALFDLWRAGHLQPHISHLLPLDRALEGLELLRSRRSTGKVVITMQAPEPAAG